MNMSTRFAEAPEERRRVHEYGEMVPWDKASLDIFWLRDDSLADSTSDSGP